MKVELENNVLVLQPETDGEKLMVQDLLPLIDATGVPSQITFCGGPCELLLRLADQNRDGFYIDGELVGEIVPPLGKPHPPSGDPAWVEAIGDAEISLPVSAMLTVHGDEEHEFMLLHDGKKATYRGRGRDWSDKVLFWDDFRHNCDHWDYLLT